MQSVLEQLTKAGFEARLERNVIRVRLPGGQTLVISEIFGAYMVGDAEGERTSIPCGTPEEVVDAVKSARG
jgi:hypothetical protein